MGSNSANLSSLSGNCRGLCGVLLERSRKLLLPLIFGMTAFGPFLRWMEMRHGLMKSIHGELMPPQNLPYVDVQSLYFRQPGMPTWAHLWFLAYLWTFTVLYAPLWILALPRLAPLVREKERGGYCILLFSLASVAMSEIYLRACWPGYQNLIDDWANFTSFSIFIVLGMVLGSFPEMQLTCRQHAFVLLTTGMAATTWHTSHCLSVRIQIRSHLPIFIAIQ